MTTHSIGKLASALSKAQAEMRGAIKDSTNPHFKNSYADLSSVWDAVREPLTKNGLSVIQTPTVNEYGTILVTILAHESGESVSSSIPLTVKDGSNYMQALGSAISYARRYSLAAITGCVQVDDDGEAATAPTPSKTAYKPQASANAAAVGPAVTFRSEVKPEPIKTTAWESVEADLPIGVTPSVKATIKPAPVEVDAERMALVNELKSRPPEGWTMSQILDYSNAAFGTIPSKLSVPNLKLLRATTNAVPFTDAMLELEAQGIGGDNGNMGFPK
jgi:hypothetical protein